MSLITFPLLNSENFYEVGVLPTNEFHTRHFLSDWWIDTIYDWQKYNRFGGVKPSQFYVLKQLDDIVTIQFNIPTTGIASFGLKMLSCDGTLRAVSPSAYMTQAFIAGNVYDGVPLRTIQYKFRPSDISGVDDGIYYFLITIDDGVEKQYISEPTDIRQTHEKTILINYTNSVNDYDVVYSLNPSFSVRLDATLSEPSNEFNPTTFRNQKGDLRQVRARNWRKYILTIGAEEGTNGIIVDKITNILKSDSITIDGKKMLLSEGAEIEVTPFSENYPLSTIKLELEEYDNSDSSVIGDTSLVYIMDVNDFPYAIIAFVLADDIGSYNFLWRYTSSNFIAEAHDSPMQAAIVSELNVDVAYYGKTGTFTIIGSALYYVLGAGEKMYVINFRKLNTCLEVDFTSVTAQRSINYDMLQSGYSVISVWKESFTKVIEIQPSLLFGDSGGIKTVGSNDTFKLYLYTDNTATRVRLVSDVTYKIITALNGKMSRSLQEFRFVGATMASLDLSFLFNSGDELRTLNWQHTTIDSVDTSGFAVPSGSQRWRYFNFLYFLNNSLDPTALDDLLNKYQLEILYTWYGLYPVGVIDLRLQSPSATRTSASDLAVTNLTATGYTILP
ncbi:MAG: hypothetical protein KAZ20_00245 [Sediminibacterium sp.]|nr:hypothetical protein [Sediminibacterium sp.]